jgi:hypothetical protein
MRKRRRACGALRQRAFWQHTRRQFQAMSQPHSLASHHQRPQAHPYQGNSNQQEQNENQCCHPRHLVSGANPSVKALLISAALLLYPKPGAIIVRFITIIYVAEQRKVYRVLRHLFHLANVAVKKIKRLLDGRGRGHIHTRVAQQVDAVIG